MIRCASLIAASLLAAQTCAAAEFADGAQAFRDGDYAAAREVWSALAAEGDARAQFNLGLLYDLGLGVAPAPGEAFRWYRAAARSGHVGAQFNVAVMLDSGIGVAADSEAAVKWYSRAAAGGHARAQYNLGQIHGSGAQPDAALARAWFSEAAQALPAARERAAALRESVPSGSSDAPPAPPRLHEALVTVSQAAPPERRAILSWTPAAESGPAAYYLEVAAPRPEEGRVVYAGYHDVSAVAVPLENGGGAFAWRVLAVAADRGRYAATPWRRVDAGPDAAADEVPLAASPKPGAPEIVIRHHRDDVYAETFAGELAADFALGGATVATEATSSARAEATEVRYFYAEDRDLARGVSTMLPVLAGDAEFAAQSDGRRPPGRVEIWLEGGVRPDSGSGGRAESDANAVYRRRICESIGC